MRFTQAATFSPTFVPEAGPEFVPKTGQGEPTINKSLFSRTTLTSQRIPQLIAAKISFLAISIAKSFHEVPTEIDDFVVKALNAWLLLVHPRQTIDIRWGNLTRDAEFLARQLKKSQFFTVYQRLSGKYKYHPLQRFEFAPRKFDLSTALFERIQEEGTSAFYSAIAPKDVAAPKVNFVPDFTRIQDLSTLELSARYLHKNLLRHRGDEISRIAKDLYCRGYSRPIRVLDKDDWEAFREEMRTGVHIGARENEVGSDQQAALIALSYKSHTMEVGQNASFLDKSGKRHQLDVKHKIVMSPLYLEDFRWSQLMRTAIQIATQEKTEVVRIWIDRLVMMEKNDEYRHDVYETKGVKWEDFGLWAYAVCPVIRLYDQNEPYYGTDFWRKLEMVMGVAGRGIFVDDYMLRQFDNSIYYGSTLYERLKYGICKIGGKGKYIRGLTLAVATAVLTDGVTVAKMNEHEKTKDSIAGWKAWSLRTIGEGAYSAEHSVVLREEPAFTVGLSQFCVIAFWESISCSNPVLEGDSYLDMSLQKSLEYRKNERWDGVYEWVGMVHDSCNFEKREQITAYLNNQAQMRLYADTMGHIAGLLTLQSKDCKYFRTIAVNLSRFSTVQSGQVIAVAEATGLNNGNSWLPWYLLHVPNPNLDQKVEVKKELGIVFEYKPIRAVYLGLQTIGWISLLVSVCSPFILIGQLKPGGFILASLIIWGILGIWALSYFVIRVFLPWPWEDTDFIGEALFDNVLMHGLFEAGIKGKFRVFEETSYEKIGWSGRYMCNGEEVEESSLLASKVV